MLDQVTNRTNTIFQATAPGVQPRNLTVPVKRRETPALAFANVDLSRPVSYVNNEYQRRAALFDTLA